jgi:branched-chain amino acid transport system permease protein
VKLNGSRTLALPALAAVVVLAPVYLSPFLLIAIGVHALWLGMGAMSLIFLSGYGGRVSLAQTAIAGIAGVTMANLFVRHGWVDLSAAGVGMLVAVAAAMLLGAVSSRSEGIYFLMITLAFSVLVQYLFEQVPSLSGHAGIGGVVPPVVVGDPTHHQTQFFYVTLGVAVVLYLVTRYVVRTPFGLTLQGTRDDPLRMRTLGYNVGLHRTLAFAFAGAIAAIAGLFSTWYSLQISPDSVNMSRTIDILIVAVIGGMNRLEGAWIGALAFALLDNYVRDLTGRFDTVIGIVFLLVVLVSPGGMLGIGQSLWARVRPGRVRSPDLVAGVQEDGAAS